MTIHLLPSLKNNCLRLFVLVFTFSFFCSEGRQITGRVLDNETQKPVRNANVIILGTTQGTITNFLGFFSISVEDQHKELVISSIGYFTSKIEIPVIAQFNILLTKEYITLPEFDLGYFEFKEVVKTDDSVDINHGSLAITQRDAKYPGGWIQFYSKLGGSLKTLSFVKEISDSPIKIKFTITREGLITDITTNNSSVLFNKKLSEVFSKFSAWKPALQNELSVPQHFALPVKWTKGVFSYTEELATPSDGMENYQKLISSNINYPNQARIAGVEGEVLVEFVVNEDGSLSNFDFLNRIGGGCEEEAIRVVYSTSNWIPAKIRGIAVKQNVVVSVFFNLNSEVKRSAFRGKIPSEELKNNIYHWVIHSIRFPLSARKNGIEGWVFVEIKVDLKTGEINSYKLAKKIGKECDDEVLRVVSSISPKAILNLKSSKETLILPVVFGLRDEPKITEINEIYDDAEILKPIGIYAIGLENLKGILGHLKENSMQVGVNEDIRNFSIKSLAKRNPSTTVISLVGREIKFIEPEIRLFYNLKSLDLENNLIEIVPEELTKLKTLTNLYLPRNRLKNLPLSFEKLISLRKVSLAYNSFQKFPQILTKLIHIEALDLANNKIKSLPSEINQLKNLQELYLQNNEITSLPPEFFELTGLKKLHLEGNPIREEDKTILKQRLSNVEIHF